MSEISEMYRDGASMLLGIQPGSYAANMARFREAHSHTLESLLNAAAQEGAQKAAESFTAAIAEAFSVKGKIPGHLQPDLNSFTVYYVLPALDLTGLPGRAALIDAICSAWAKRFRRGNIRFASYETILNSFRRTILGIPL